MKIFEKYTLINDLALKIKNIQATDDGDLFRRNIVCSYYLLIILDTLQSIPKNPHKNRIIQTRNGLAHNKNLELFDVGHNKNFERFIADECSFYQSLALAVLDPENSSEIKVDEWQQIGASSNYVTTDVEEIHRIKQIKKLLKVFQKEWVIWERALTTNTKINEEKIIAIVVIISQIGELSFAHNKHKKRQNALVELSQHDNELIETIAVFQKLRDKFYHPADLNPEESWAKFIESLQTTVSQVKDIKILCENFLSAIKDFFSYKKNQVIASQRIFQVLNDTCPSKENPGSSVEIGTGVSIKNKFLLVCMQYQYVFDRKFKLSASEVVLHSLMNENQKNLKKRFTFFRFVTAGEIERTYKSVIENNMINIQTAIEQQRDATNTTEIEALITDLQCNLARMSLVISQSLIIVRYNLFLISVFYKIPELPVFADEMVKIENEGMKKCAEKSKRSDCFSHAHSLLTNTISRKYFAKIIGDLVDNGARIFWGDDTDELPHFLLLIERYSDIVSFDEKENYRKLLLKIWQKKPSHFNLNRYRKALYSSLSFCDDDMLDLVIENKLFDLEKPVKSEDLSECFLHHLMRTQRQENFKKYFKIFDVNSPIYQTSSSHKRKKIVDFPLSMAVAVFANYLTEQQMQVYTLMYSNFLQLVADSRINLLQTTYEGNTALHLLCSETWIEDSTYQEQLLKLQWMVNDKRVDLMQLNKRYQSPLSLALNEMAIDKVMIIMDAALKRGQIYFKEFMKSKAIGFYQGFCSRLAESYKLGMALKSPKEFKKSRLFTQAIGAAIKDKKSDLFFYLMEERTDFHHLRMPYQNDSINQKEYLEASAREEMLPAYQYFGFPLERLLELTEEQNKSRNQYAMLCKSVIDFSTALLHRINALNVEAKNEKNFSKRMELLKNLQTILKTPLSEQWKRENHKLIADSSECKFFYLTEEPKSQTDTLVEQASYESSLACSSS